MAKKKHFRNPQSRWAEKKRKLGLCRVCGKKRGKHKWLCDLHGDQFKKYMRKWRLQRKMEKEQPNGNG